MTCHTDGNCCGPGSYCCEHNAPHTHADDGEAAIRREVAACEAEELDRVTVRFITPEQAREEYDLERTDAAREDFKAKLAYWREHGAPAYHGPRATKR